MYRCFIFSIYVSYTYFRYMLIYTFELCHLFWHWYGIANGYSRHIIYLRKLININIMVRMQNKYSLYIPSTIGDEPIDKSLHDAHTRGYANMMLAEFGGVTITKGIGMWTNEAKITVTENVSIITASTNIDAFEFMQMLAENVKNLLKQECVSLEVNGVLYLI